VCEDTVEQMRVFYEFPRRRVAARFAKAAESGDEDEDP
jgi:hypothetical protein